MILTKGEKQNYMNKIFILCFLLTSFLSTYAQKALPEKDVNRLILETLSSNKQNLSSLKDSIDFYAFAIELDVSSSNKNTHVTKIKVNDSVANTIYADFDFLKKINYVNMLKGRKQAKIIIPVGIIIAYVKNPVMPVPLLKAEELMPKLSKLFKKDFEKNNPLSDFIYLDPFICLCSTKVYH